MALEDAKKQVDHAVTAAGFKGHSFENTFARLMSGKGTLHFIKIIPGGRPPFQRLFSEKVVPNALTRSILLSELFQSKIMYNS